MCAPSAPGTLRGMDVTRPVQVMVEMEPTAGTIRGRISVDGAPASGFFGWLELIDRLERAAAARRHGLTRRHDVSGIWEGI
jgi:hypothetical protein